MTEPTIICPSCAAAIPLTQSLAAPLLASERRAIAAREAEVARARDGVAAEVAARLAVERRGLAAEAEAAARAAEAERVAGLEARLAEREAKLAEAQAAQAQALRATRALEDARRELELTIEKQVAERLGAARSEAEAAMRLRVAEREATIEAMRRQIEDLKRRSEQGSQQLQGEALELDLGCTLAARFPLDTFEPVGKGVSGADLIQRVAAPAGTAAGVILWEAKRTKGWNDDWLVKLRADQRAIGADVAILTSQALPRGVESFELIDGVWVAPPRLAPPLAAAIRAALIELASVKTVRRGQGTKMELVYDYLTGPRFRHRVEAIVERFSDMSADLDREKKAMTRLWAKREMQIAGVLDATVGLYGDLQGIAGKALGEIEGLEIAMLDAPAS